MRQDTTVARFLIIFSIANVLLAAPAVVRQGRSVTDGSYEESTDVSFLTLPLPASELPHRDSVPRPPPGSLYRDWAAPSVPISPQSRDDQPSGQETQRTQPPLQSLPGDETPPASGPVQMHDDSASTEQVVSDHVDNESKSKGFYSLGISDSASDVADVLPAEELRTKGFCGWFSCWDWRFHLV